MPYLLTPRWARVAESATRTLLYSMVFLAGLSSVFLTPVTVSGVVGTTLLHISGWALMIAAIPGMIGAALRRYQFEWVAIWAVSGGSVTYVATVWSLVNSETLTRLTQSSFVTIAFLAMVIRAINLTVIAQRKRELYQVTNGD
jgi:hypothetical protein